MSNAATPTIFALHERVAACAENIAQMYMVVPADDWDCNPRNCIQLLTINRRIGSGRSPLQTTFGCGPLSTELTSRRDCAGNRARDLLTIHRHLHGQFDVGHRETLAPASIPSYHWPGELAPDHRARKQIVGLCGLVQRINVYPAVGVAREGQRVAITKKRREAQFELSLLHRQ